MGPFSRIKSEVGTVEEIEAYFEYDERWARRWKRRRIAYGNCKLSSSSDNAHKKTIDKNNQEGGVVPEILTIDSDYEDYLTDMEQFDVCDDRDSVDDNGNGDSPPALVQNDDPLTIGWSDDGDIPDPQYMMFLDNIKEDGNSYVLTLAFGNDTPLVVRYEREDEIGRENLEAVKGLPKREKIERPRSILKSSSGREKIESPRSDLMREKTQNLRKSSGSDAFREIDETLSMQGERTEDPKTFRNAPRRKNMEAQTNLGNVPTVDRKAPVVEKNELEAANLFNCTTNDSESDLMDESYQAFLNSVKEVGQNLVYAPEGGAKVVYEKDDANDSDSELIILDYNPCSGGDHTPFVSSKPCVIYDVEDEECKETQYREKLMEILQKPYDHKELEDLMHEASRRRPQKRYMELRGASITCTLDSLGKSYLEEYSDLARKIREGRDQHRKLNVLRGFFYWLQNLPFEGGAFKPWLDASCLGVLPGT